MEFGFRRPSSMKSPWKMKGTRGIVGTLERDGCCEETRRMVGNAARLPHRVDLTIVYGVAQRDTLCGCAHAAYTRVHGWPRSPSVRERRSGGWQRGWSNSERHQLGQYSRPCPSSAPLPSARKCSLAAPMLLSKDGCERNDPLPPFLIIVLRLLSRIFR